MGLLQDKLKGGLASRIAPIEEEPLTFGERFKMSFGSPETRGRLKEREAAEGKRGVFEIGDIADVMGTLPILAGGTIGGIAGTALGAPNIGAGIGASLGELARNAVGQAFGTAEEFDLAEAGKTAALTAGGGFVLGKLFTAVSKALPEKLTAIIFKETADDIARNMKKGALDPTLSQEILQEGLYGPPERIMKQSFQVMNDLETKIRTMIGGKRIMVPKINAYKKLLNNYVGVLRETSYGFEPKVMQGGQQLLVQLKNAKGKSLSAETVLNLRRFLDTVRKHSSFKANTQLSPREMFYKEAADSLRIKLAKIEGVAPLMNRYRIHINAFNRLAKYMERSQNKNLFDMLDVMIAWGINPAGILVRRALQMARPVTTLAQGLYRGGKLAEKIPPGIVPTVAGKGVSSLFESR